MNSQGAIKSYLPTNPWDLAYVTLSYIAEHNDHHIWAQEVSQGIVPSYYACMFYLGRGKDVAFGKCDLKSV